MIWKKKMCPTFKLFSDCQFDHRVFSLQAFECSDQNNSPAQPWHWQKRAAGCCWMTTEEKTKKKGKRREKGESEIWPERIWVWFCSLKRVCLAARLPPWLSVCVSDCEIGLFWFIISLINLLHGTGSAKMTKVNRLCGLKFLAATRCE